MDYFSTSPTGLSTSPLLPILALFSPKGEAEQKFTCFSCVRKHNAKEGEMKEEAGEAEEKEPIAGCITNGGHGLVSTTMDYHSFKITI